MKKFLYAFVMCLPLLAFTSCSEDSDDPSKITYYPALELQGDATMLINAGEPFADPGCVATMKGEDVSDMVEVSTDLDFANPLPGVYEIDYFAVNEDGFSASTSRTVYVAAPGGVAPSGCYINNYQSSTCNGSQRYFTAPFEMVLLHLGNNRYYISDIFGGWYAQGAEYGADYAMTARFAVNEDNTLTLIGSYLNGWGDSLDSLEGTYDPDTKMFNFMASYSGGYLQFNVYMTAVE